MRASAVRRAHVAASAVFADPASSVWTRFEGLDDLRGLEDVLQVRTVGRHRSRHVIVRDDSFGVVESIMDSASGIVRYRARVPGGSVGADLDGVIRLSDEPDGGTRVTWTAELVSDRGGQGREATRRWLSRRLEHAGGRLLPPLTMDIWLGGSPMSTGRGDDGRSSTTATLLSGIAETILIDARMPAEQAVELVAWLQSIGRPLNTIVVTQEQAHHSRGLDVLLRSYPGARAVATSAVLARGTNRTALPGLAVHGGHVDAEYGREPTATPAPEATGGLTLDGHAIHLFDLGTLAGHASSAVWVRDLDAMIGGDLMYNGVHPRLAGTSSADRRLWSRSLDLMDALRPAWAVGAHRARGAASDATAPQVAWMRRYLSEFDELAAAAHSPAELVRAIDRRHPGLGDLAVLRASAASQFADRMVSPSGPRSHAPRRRTVVVPSNTGGAKRLEGAAMPYITTSDGVEIYVTDQGEGRPIVFSHGWPLSSDAWQPELKFFSDNGFRAIAHDRRGHGRSGKTAEGHAIDQYARDLADVIEALDLRDVIVVGHSTGGGEVVRYAARYANGRVAKVVTIGAIPPIMVQSESNPEGTPIEVFDGIRAGVLGDASQFWLDLAESFFGANHGRDVSFGAKLDFWRQGQLANLSAVYDCITAFSETEQTEDLRAIDVPILIAHGEDDQIVPIADSAHKAVELVQNGTLKTYPGAPHGIHGDYRAQLDQDILEWIRR